MRTPVDHAPKALRGILISAILFLTVLPYFGTAWHRVLPEHQHIFFSVHHDDAEEDVVPTAPSPANEPDSCVSCSGEQISSGMLHLPGSMVAQILGIAVSIAALFLIRMPPQFSTRVVLFPVFYRAPSLSPLDPPPTVN